MYANDNIICTGSMAKCKIYVKNNLKDTRTICIKLLIYTCIVADLESDDLVMGTGFRNLSSGNYIAVECFFH